ncbi:hypothetical protein [Actinoallomurus sp. CA-150999]|uniref:hypothetical protein n=1 Tax=Actinoallomurus sp. CA-150999 TaxID=3239887 RepID=UPI003D8B3EBF
MEKRSARAFTGDKATPATAATAAPAIGTPTTATPTVATPTTATPTVATLPMAIPAAEIRAVAIPAVAALPMAVPAVAALATTAERPPSDLIIWSPFAEILLGDEITTGVAAGGAGETRFDGIFVRRRPCDPHRCRAAGTTSGVPVSGSSITRHGGPKTSSTGVPSTATVLAPTRGTVQV